MHTIQRTPLTPHPLFPHTATDEGFTVGMPPVLDLHNRQSLRAVVEELLAEPGLVIRFDCAHLVYVDSSGLGVLVSLNKAVKRAGKRLVLANFTNDDLRVLFELTRIEYLFTIEPPFDR